MADVRRSAREMERAVERERAELRDAVDALFEVSARLGADEICTRLAATLRRDEVGLGEGLVRVARERPLALGLTALGVGLLMFGPPRRRARGEGGGEFRYARPFPRPFERGYRDYDEEARDFLERSGFEEDRPDADGRDAARAGAPARG
ncbi:hypothetical protein P6F26_16555 [Roseibacterium sp. SDUM158017]|uniref:hypothetical protein n=1 Tax=Roseicyclus salinarum TaxID=3036773 RepID=UPI002414D4F5|nr:hypothetical protein [Roseibacterium sp. SDUM158017]MDG4650060.1 hypothetical protein [Roseibacterium sp. SDUM158017]